MNLYDIFDKDKELKKINEEISKYVNILVDLRTDLDNINKQFVTIKEEKEDILLETKGQTLPVEFFIERQRKLKNINGWRIRTRQAYEYKNIEVRELKKIMYKIYLRRDERKKQIREENKINDN